jgi:hypothetical protein
MVRSASPFAIRYSPFASYRPCATFLNAEKISMTCFDILEKKNHRIFDARRWARAATHPEAARVGNGLETAFSGERTGNELRPNRGTRPLVTAG